MKKVKLIALLYAIAINTTALKKLSLILLCLSCCMFSIAQNAIDIKGIITDDKGAPLSSASVVLKGTKLGTVSNSNGVYTFSIDKAGTLVFSYAGYINKEVAVTSSQTINVSLTANNSTLNDVVVTGYSKQSKRDVTGAVSTVSADVISKTPVSDIGQVLQGRVAGVSVDDQGGPGSSAVVRIRGFGTLGDNDPLYVIDGVQMRGSNNLVNTNDIETITVLKDPSLTSLYGAEGSNGVIVITTKTGKIGAPKLEYDTYMGTERPIKYPSVLTPQQYADAYWQYLKNSDLPLTDLYYGKGNKPVLPDYIIETQSGTPMVIHPGNPAPDTALYNLNNYRIIKTNKNGTDWFRQIFNPAFTQNHQLTVSGATDKSNYALSFSFLDDKGVILKTFYRRYSIRVNTDFKVKPWLRVGENIEFSYSVGGGINNHSTGNVVSDLYQRSPLIPVYDVAGNYTGPKGITSSLDFQPGGNNPVLGQTNGANTYKGFNAGLFGSSYIDVEPIKGLVFESKIGVQLYPYQYHYFLDTFPQNVYSGKYNSFSEGGGYSLDWRWTNKVSYDINIHRIHKISAFVAYETRKYVSRFNGATTPNLPYTLPSYLYLSSGVPIDSIHLENLVTGGGDIQKNLSLFGNINYSLLDKYLFSFVLRRDGSSKFGRFNRYGTFPSASVGWRISSENFMQHISWLDDLKLKAAVGTNGNDAIPSGLTVNQFSSYAYNNSYDLGGNNTSASTGFGLYQIGNPYLRWEVNKTTNIGLDAALFKNRITASLNWFNRTTNHLLYTPPFTGLEGDAIAPFQNVLKFSNKGVELELNYTSAKHTLSYDMNFNIATYRNKVLYISDDTSAFITGDNYAPTQYSLNRSKVGLPVASFFGYIQEGIFQTVKDVTDHAAETGIDKADPATGLGHFMFKDINNDGVIDDNDRTYIGNPHPKFTYGYTLNLYYKNFDLNIFLEGVAGNKIFNYWRSVTRWPGGLGTGSDDTWTPANTNAKLPVWKVSGATDDVPSTFFIENGSYLRLKSLQLGYTFPKSKAFSKLRIYAQAYNITTFTKYSGIDPEVSTGDPGSIGIDFGGNYPIALKILFGINIGL